MSKLAGKVIGVGGVFFRSKDPARLGAWYRDVLGLDVEAWGDTHGTSFAPESMPPNSFTVWSAFDRKTEYFGAASQAYMINLVVDDLEAVLAQVSAAGGKVLPEREDADFGNFAWINDPEGNRVELWQPPAQMPEEGNDE